MLKEGFIGLVRFLALHPDIHADQRDSEKVLRRIVVVPKGLHGLVRLYSAGIIADALGYVFGILVIGEEYMYLVPVSFET